MKKFKENVKKTLASILAFAIIFTSIFFSSSMSVHAEEPAGRGTEWDYLYSEIRSNGSGKAYPVGTRIYMDIKPKSGTDDEEDDHFYIDSLETAVSYEYITVDGDIDEDVAKYYFTSLSINLGDVITLEESYYEGTKKIKSGGYWIFNLNNGSGDEFYGVVASSEKDEYKNVKVPTSKLDIVGSTKHTHQWNYTLSEDGKTITANCTNADGNCEYRDATDLTYSVEAENKTYSGNAYDGISVTDNITSVTGAEPSIKYYLADGTTLTTAENSGAAADGGAPVNAGSYMVKVTIGEATASTGFKITALVGSGTEDNPYIISSTAELKGILDGNEAGEYYKLSDDFDNTYVLTESLSQFNGNLDGNGKTINVNIDNTGNGKYTGLFTVNDGQISNLNVDGKLQGNSSPTGGICAYMYEPGVISNCNNYAEVIGKDEVGGICACMYDPGVISNCNNYAEVIGKDEVGGICGNNYDSEGSILQCNNYGNISGTKKVGGICGVNIGSVKGCENTGSVTAENHYAEGIVGKNGTSSKDASVENCKNYGTVTCEPYKEYIGYDNSQMAYKENDGSYSVIGKVGNAWHQIHYWDGSLKCETNNKNLSVSLTPEIVSDGKLLKFTVSITNSTSDTISEAKVTVCGDTELSGCDRSTNKTNASNSIMTMSYNGITFLAFSKDTGFRIVNTDFDNYSYIDAPQVNEKCDSAYSAQWNIDSIAGNETVTRTFYMGCTEGESLSDADLNKIVNAAAHTHEWKYSVNGNKMEVYCAAEGCPSGTSESNKSALTLTATNADYSGQAYNGAVVEDNISSLTGQTARVTYVGRDGTTYAESTTAPTNAGSYMVKVAIGSETLTAPFEILPEEMKDATFEFDHEQFEYNGAEHSPSITVKNGDVTLEEGKDYTVAGKRSATSIGEYSITITGKGNYTGTFTKTWKITKKLINSDLINITNNSFTYDGKPHVATVSVNDLEGATITYSESENGTYKPEAPNYTSVGTHKVYYKIEKEGYEPATGSFDLTILEGTTHHDIKTTDSEHGRVSTSRTDAGWGAEVTLTATPDAGYRFKEWKVVKGENITITNNRFVMPDEEVEIQAVFEQIPSSSGGSGSTPAESRPGNKEDYKVPVKNEDTVQVDVAITDGKAEVSDITEDTLNSVINNQNKESKVDTISIDLSGAKQTVTAVSLSKTTVKALCDAVSDQKNGINSTTIALSNATVTLDAKTLQTLEEQAKGSQIELVVEDTKQNNLNVEQKKALEQHRVATTFEAYFVSDGERIHDFNGGNAVVAVRFAPEAGRDARYYHVVYVAEDGKLTYYKTRCKNGKIEFTTTHFSDYAIVYDDSEKNDTDADNSGKDVSITVDSSYAALRLRVTKSTKTGNVLKWAKYTGADGYVVYGNKCNTGSNKYKLVRIATVNGDKTSYTSKNLTKGTYYKYYVKAYKLVDGRKVWLAASKVIHVTTGGGKYGNAKGVSVNKSGVTLTAGKSATIQAKQIEEKYPIKHHADIRYESTDQSVATVNKNGVIKAKKTGTAYIYVYAQNGVYKKVKVTVK